MKLLKYVFMLPLNIVYCVACFIPKDKNLWLFGAWFGEKFLDNPKYIFKEALLKNNEVKVYWVTKKISLNQELQKRGYPSVYAYSFKGIFFQLRASIVIFSHGVSSEFLASFVGYSTKRIQTWHGAPIKKIAYDDKNGGLGSTRSELIRFIFPFLKIRYDLVLAASAEDKKIYNTAFRTPLDRIAITGYPRNDEVLRSLNRPFGTLNKYLKILYMPTLRGAHNSEFMLLSQSGFDYVFADKFLAKKEAKLYIKLHPVQEFTKRDLEEIDCSDQITAIFNNDDLYETIGSYDILITDYSGIFFDFLITGKPIIMAPIDFEAYTTSDREIYYDYLDLCPIQPCFSWDDLFKSLEKILVESQENKNYRRIQKRFHKFLDGKSSERALIELDQITCS